MADRFDSGGVESLQHVERQGERKRKVVGLVEKEGGNSLWSIIKVLNSSP